MDFMLTDVPSFWLIVLFGFVGWVIAALFNVGDELATLIGAVIVVICAYLFGRFTNEFIFWPLGSVMLGGAIGIWVSDLNIKILNLNVKVSRLNSEINGWEKYGARVEHVKEAIAVMSGAKKTTD